MKRLARYPYLVFSPLVHHFRLGEGLLLAINATIIAFVAPPPLRAALQLAFSGVVIAVLYSYNDLIDCQDDRNNPKKDPRLVGTFIEYEREFTPFLYALKLALVALAWALLDPRAAVVVAAVFAINMLYSLRVKSLPFVDIAIVGVWGAVYAAIPDTPWRVCVLVGVMTSVSHIFQILVDRDVDARNDVHTTAVHSLRTTEAMLVGMCALLYALLLGPLGPFLALTAFLPFGSYLGLSRVGAAWMLSRAYFGLALLATLGVGNDRL